MALWGAASSRTRAWGASWSTEGAYAQRARGLVQICQPVSARAETGSQIVLSSTPLFARWAGSDSATPTAVSTEHLPRGEDGRGTKAARWLGTKDVKGDGWPFSMPSGLPSTPRDLGCA